VTKNTITTSTSNTTANKNTTNSNNIKAAAGEPKTLTQNQILTASKSVNTFINKNKKLPNSVKIGGYTFSMNEYAYLLSKTIHAKYNKKTNAITIKYDIKNPSKASGVNIKGKLTRAQYYTFSRNLYTYMDKHNKAPNFSNTRLGKMQYQTAIFALNKIAYFAATKNGALPSTVTINIKRTHTLNRHMPNYVRSNSGTVGSGNVNTGSSSTISLADIRDAATRVNAYVNQNDVLPNNVEIRGTTYTMARFLYLLSVAITNTNGGSTKGVTLISVNNPNAPSGKSINGNMAKATYVSLAKNVTTFITKNKRAPNFVNSPLGAMQYQTIVSEFSKIVERNLPNSVTINVKSTDRINGGSGSGNNGGSSTPSTSLNDKNTFNATELARFLVATKNCQVNNSIIQSLAANITKGLTTDREKATAIFNWVQKNIDYQFYYNTRKGAVNTISAKGGNCVDMSHLSVALYRAAGLAARYVHGECTFTSSGSTYGHVWVQVLIGDTWTVSDTTSSRNSLGVVNNWNVNTYKFKSGKVAEISF